MIKNLPIIGITMGDPSGIGAEIILKTLAKKNISKYVIPVIIGSYDCLLKEAERINLQSDLYNVHSVRAAYSGNKIAVLDCDNFSANDFPIGEVSAISGKAAGVFIVRAAQLAIEGVIDAIVTAPINKASLNKSGYEYPGHTEFLSALTGTPYFAMMLTGEKLRVVLITTHLPLAEVSKTLNEDLIIKKIEITIEALREYWNIDKPSIGVLALNPHAGDNGLLGREEIEIIIPALEKLRKREHNIIGPLPPDTGVLDAQAGKFDVLIAMYHDQGLIPFKMLNFGCGVNITLGLPILRTSPDHGTAFDIAGKNIANPESFNYAYQLAIDLIYNKQNKNSNQ